MDNDKNVVFQLLKTGQELKSVYYELVELSDAIIYRDGEGVNDEYGGDHLKELAGVLIELIGKIYPADY